jgi:hypothetical protein
VDPSAEDEVIAAAYKRLSLKYHPDTNAGPEATRRMQEINEAYSVLKDPYKRRQYDQMQRSGYREAPYEPPPWSSPPPRSSPPPGPPPGPPRREPVRKTTPQQALASMVVSLSFPITYVLMTMLLFRVFPVRTIITVPLVLVTAGVIAYYVSLRVDKALRK